MATDNNNGGKAKIKINRKMRTWNKFKKYIIGGGLAIIVIVVAAIVVTKVAKKPVKSSTKNAKVATENVTQSVVETQAETESAVKETTPETTTAANTTGQSYTVTAKATEETFSAGDYYSNAAFLGDSVMSGLAHYGLVGSDRVVSDANMTTDKASGYVDSIAAINPSTVYVMVGLNDFNYGTRTAQDAYNYMVELVNSLKSKLPSAKIVILSVTPISTEYDDNAAHAANQADIDTYNNLLSTGASTGGYTYVNVADSFKDETGHLSASMTNAGYELKAGYFPFLLNKIAEVLK
ncbi:GDSL-type esterase/lipase family protein [Lachnospira multipara]|uniref:GDSL-type esterase/lipase family protein n=1 Tax=Lachnospira multipara TaxID=28051 RepID=UPI0004E1FA53|nr:GDSL-type esterase/lipase family protein [Lachnospira multipara]